MKKLMYISVLILTSILNVHAADDATPAATDSYAYFGFDPQIVTNYISNRKKLGYVKISVELMVKNPADLVIIERNEPLLRAALLEIVGNQTEETVKSLKGREKIRQTCFDALNTLITKEAGKPLIAGLLFTSYLYD
jgi:flagellar protein FliL